MSAYGRAVQHVDPVAVEDLRPGLSAWDRYRLVLLAVSSLLLLLVVVLGQRETPLADLEAAVAEGRVDSVVVLGQAGTGDALSTQEVRWTDGLVRRTARATVGAVPSGGVVDGTVRSEDLGVLLSRADPGLEVRRSPQGMFAPYGELLGWRVPGWLALTALVALPRAARAAGQRAAALAGDALGLVLDHDGAGRRHGADAAAVGPHARAARSSGQAGGASPAGGRSC